jgi:spore cortex protein
LKSTYRGVFVLNKLKKTSAFTAIAILSTGLSACNGDKGALDTRYNDNAQPMGYYSNENTNVDNEGPVTEMMDGMNNDNNENYFRRVNDRYQNRNMSNQTVPLGNQDNGLLKDNRFRKNDVNYHGHLRNVANNQRDDGKTAQQVRNAVEKINNVDEARVLVTDNNLIVAVDTQDYKNNKLKDRITKQVQKMANGRNIQVVTDEGSFTRIRNIDNDIQNGVDRKTIDADINNLMDDIGDVIQRPLNGDRE